MTATPTPRALGFPEPDVPMAHVPDWRLFDEATRAVACLRCHAMVNVVQWASEICTGETIHESPPAVSATDPTSPEAGNAETAGAALKEEDV